MVHTANKQSHAGKGVFLIVSWQVWPASPSLFVSSHPIARGAERGAL
jgi:hypothetical protein